MKLEEIEAEVLKLGPESRARLAKRLIESLDELSEAEREQLWLEEAERRQHELETGEIEAQAAEDVFRRARSELS